LPLATRHEQLSPDQPHRPARDKHSANKHGEAIQSIPNLLTGSVLLRDAEDDRGKQSEDDRGRKVSQGKGHGFFPKAM